MTKSKAVEIIINYCGDDADDRGLCVDALCADMTREQAERMVDSLTDKDWTRVE